MEKPNEYAVNVTAFLCPSCGAFLGWCKHGGLLVGAALVRRGDVECLSCGWTRAWCQSDDAAQQRLDALVARVRRMRYNSE
jgi:predicted RNA-binding Zn-ribbon protein involved in translation (DUF1610 family)